MRSLYVGDLSYVPRVRTCTTPLFYLVTFSGVHWGCVELYMLHFLTGIIDSSTTLMVVTSETYNAFRDYFPSHYCNVQGICPTSAAREILSHPHFRYLVPGKVVSRSCELAAADAFDT